LNNSALRQQAFGIQTNITTTQTIFLESLIFFKLQVKSAGAIEDVEDIYSSWRIIQSILSAKS